MSTTLPLFPAPADSRVIAHVYLTAGGNVFCFDARSNMLDQFCGPWRELEPSVRRHMRHDAEVHE